VILATLLLALQGQGPPTGYWQQHLEYDIEARLDERRGTLSGTQRIRYHNNSPDTLHTFSLHLYLNAFRPGSRWADADSAEGRRRFNDLRDPDYGYNRIAQVRIMDQAVEPIYPFAPDSTIARFPLPAAVAPGDSFSVALEWEARPSTVPRRQGRRGRHYDFAQWYPRVVAYDRYGWAEHPLYPGGEFYGDFGDFRVTLDVPEDQVVGATGVPVCGDPGWERVNRTAGQPVEYGRERYGPVVCSGPEEAGRKRIVWVARDVHHFALSMDPAYRYEGGRFGDVLVHVLYQPGDERTWGGGVAVRNTVTALAWLDRLFGRFAWPQVTNVHRIEAGATEFPMMVMNGSAGLGLIVHEVGHNYLMGILANNEWKEGWLDEGFTSFQTSLFMERTAGRTNYPALERSILLQDLDGWSQPVSQPGETFRDFATYNAMTYNRGELFFHQLRAIVGDSTMGAILRAYYDRWKLRHVDETAFREVAEEVSGRDLRTFFAQWLHSTVLYDYRVGRVDASAAGRQGGSYVTRVEVVRKAPGVFPVTVVVRSREDSALTRVDGMAERQWVELETRGRPREVELDPEGRSHDWNVLDNRRKRGLLGFRPAPRTRVYFDRFLTQPVRRDGLTLGLAPVAWYNDEGGLTVGLRSRSDYLGRFQRNVGLLSLETRRLSDGDSRPGGFSVRLQNPVALYRPRVSQTLEGYWVEGRAGIAASAERDLSRRRTGGFRQAAGAGLRWMVTTDTNYLDSARWDAGGTVEASTWWRGSDSTDTWKLGWRGTMSGGIEYRNRGPGTATEDRYDVQPYARVLAEFTAERRLAPRAGLSVRAFAGGVFSRSLPLKQRQIFAAGADPYEQFGNPLVRSRGALLVRDGVHYLVPGGGGVRGLAPWVSTTRLVSVNTELDRTVFSRPSRSRGLLHEIRVALFSDIAVGNGDLPGDGAGAAIVADAGVGIRLGHRIGDTFWTSRIDFPLYVSRGSLANRAPEHGLGLRWVWTVQR
jgi:hypothetical protein